MYCCLYSGTGSSETWLFTCTSHKLKLLFMQKTTTLKDFKVLVLKTILPILVLGISFQVSFAQDLQSAKGKLAMKRAELANPKQTDARPGSTTVVQQVATVPTTPVGKVAMQKTEAARAAAVTSQSNKARTTNLGSLTAEQTQSDNPAAHQAYLNSFKGSSPPSPNSTTVACLFNGTIAAGDLSMTTRLFRPGGAGGTCAASQPFPGTITQTVLYDKYTFTNTTGAAACVTANLTTTDPAANIQEGAWLGSFDPANLATNYIADPYVSLLAAGPPGITCSFNLANNATVVFVVWSLNPTNSGYTLSVDGLPNLCPQPTCVPPTGSVLNALSQSLNERFDATVPPAGWSIKNNSSPIGTTIWRQGTPDGVFTSHSGAGFAAVNFTSGAGLATLSNWLVGPVLTLQNGDQFKFWTRAATGGGVFPDRLQVRMSQNGASTNVGTLATDLGDFTSLLLDINPTYSTTGYPEVWTQFTATVAGVPAAGVSGRMAFRYFVENGGPAGANSNYIGVDDVQYLAGGNPTVCAGSTGFLSVTITGGSSPYTVVIHPSVGADITAGPGYTSGTLIPVTVNVSTTYNLVSVTSSGSGSGCSGGTLSGTPTIGLSPASTAAVLSQVQVAGPPVNLFNQGFEGAIPTAGWPIQNLSSPIGVVTWNQGAANGVFPPHLGVGYASVNFNSGGGLATISNWMFAPSVLLKNGDTFSFWTRAATGGGVFPDRLQVRMNTTNTGNNVGATATSVGDFSTLLLDINPTYSTTGYPEAWTQYSVTLSGLPAAGVSGVIAFRYFVENGGPAGANSNYIGIDDAIYTTQTLINPTTCTGSTANLKVDITGGSAPYEVQIAAAPSYPGFPLTVSNYTSGANIPVTPPITTTYSLVYVKSANGCSGSGNSGTPTVVVSPTVIGPITIIDQPSGPLCAGDPKLLTVTGAASTATFTNPAAITIPSSGTATPSPATLVVAGLPAGTTVSSVIINNFSHTWSGDVNIVLQQPGTGTNVILKGDSNTDPFIPATGVTLTFKDAPAATQSLPTTGTLVTGTYLPTNRNGSPFAFLAPGPTVTGPTFPASPTLASFTGSMNGTWNLYVEDRVAGDQGSIAGGYTINFSVPSAPPVGYTWLWTPAAGLSSTTSNPTAASPMLTTTYTVMGTAPSGCQTTAAITITVNQLPAVTAQPVATSVCENGNATFSVTGSGANIAYQWQVSTAGVGGPYANIANGALYSGVTSSTLSITGVTNAMNGWFYRCAVSGTCPPVANSIGAKLTVVAGPVVTLSSTGTVCGGVPGIGGLTLTASGASTYTWAPATGLFTDPLATVAYVAGANANPVYPAPTVYTTYTVTGTNTATGCTKTATVNINATPPPPVITPNPVSMCLGDAPVRLINASNAPGSCVVNSGAINLPIADGAQPGIASTLAVNCVPVGATITSIAVKFSVPAHTYIADLTVNLKAPNGTVLNLDKNLGATGNQAGAYPNLGIVNATIASNGVAALSTAATTPLTGLWKADLINGGITPGYTFGDPTGYAATATAWSQLYSVPNGNWTLAIIDDGAGDVGSLTNWSITINYTPGVPTAPAVWTPNFPGPNNYLWLDLAKTLPYIAGTPKDTVYTQPVPAGTYTYNATVQGLPTPPVTITTTSAGGNGNNMIFFNLQNTNATPYTLKSVSTNAFAAGTVPSVNLWMKTTAIAGNPGLINPGNGWNIVGTAPNVTVAANVLNQVISNMNVLIPGGVTYGFGVEFTGAVTFPAYTNGTGAVQTYSGNGFNILVDGNIGWGGPVAPGPPANNPRNFNGSVSLVSNVSACTSPARVVTVNVNTPIAITTQPVSHSVCTSGTNNTTSFTTAATGSGVSYQWQVSLLAGSPGTFNNIANGGVYSGVTTGTLTITNPPVSMNGYVYSCLVSGIAPCPAVPSNNAVLTVNPLPTIVINASPYYNLLPGLTTTLFSTVSPIAATYTWFKNGAPVSGATASSLLLRIDDQGVYNLKVLDVNGCTNTSNSITIADSTSGRVWIYPSPTSGQFVVRYNPAHNNVLPRGLNIRNAQGQLVYTQNYTLGIPFSAMKVDMSNMASGVYWVEVTDVDGNRLAVGRVEIAH